MGFFKIGTEEFLSHSILLAHSLGVVQEAVGFQGVDDVAVAIEVDSLGYVQQKANNLACSLPNSKHMQAGSENW